MTDFLETLDFLTPDQRSVLRRADFDQPDAIAERPPAYFEGQPYDLSPGKASRLVAAAKRIGMPQAAAPVRVTVDQPDIAEQIGKALRERPVRPARLHELGVTMVVVADNGSIDADRTENMRQFARPGQASPGRTWYGARVVSVDDLAPPTWINPRTGRTLQGAGVDGIDEITLLPWGKLGEDGLKLAKFAEEQGFLRGMTDEAVIEAFERSAGSNASPLRTKVAQRLLAVGVDLRDIDVTASATRTPPVDRQAPEPSPTSLPRSPVSALSEFFGRAFQADDLRRLLGYLPDGRRITNELPGSNAPSGQVFHSAADILVRFGYTRDADARKTLRDALVSARPRRSDEIDRILGAYS